MSCHVIWDSTLSVKCFKLTLQQCQSPGNRFFGGTPGGVDRGSGMEVAISKKF